LVLEEELEAVLAWEQEELELVQAESESVLALVLE